MTKDHIPPKNLFPKPLPSNLITVVSCFKCNKSFEKDDEYFMTILAHSQGVEKHKDGKNLIAKLSRMYKRNKSIPLLKRIVDTSEPVKLYSPEGTFIEETLGVMPEANRLTTFMSRITKGIYFHVTNNIFPTGNKIALTDKANIEIQPEYIRDSLRNIYRTVEGQKLHIIGDNIFAYRYFFLEDSINTFVSLFSFFGDLHYMTLSNHKIEVIKKEGK